MLPQQFKSNYLTQQMAVKIGSKLMKAEFYWDGLESKVRRMLIEPIEKESGRSFPDVLALVNSFDLTNFLTKCKSFAK